MFLFYLSSEFEVLFLKFLPSLIPPPARALTALPLTCYSSDVTVSVGHISVPSCLLASVPLLDYLNLSRLSVLSFHPALFSCVPNLRSELPLDIMFILQRVCYLLSASSCHSPSVGLSGTIIFIFILGSSVTLCPPPQLTSWGTPSPAPAP